MVSVTHTDEHNSLKLAIVNFSKRLINYIPVLGGFIFGKHKVVTKSGTFYAPETTVWVSHLRSKN